MSWITVIWSMSASACLTLAGLHVLVWFNDRRSWDHLLFVASALAAAALAAFELNLMRAETTAQYGELMRWGHVPIAIMVFSIVWFVRLRLRAGRRWLAWAVCGSRMLALALTFVLKPNLHFREITGLGPFRLFGESVSVAVGKTNPWALIGQLSLVLLLVFCVDAMVAVWKRGDRRLALIVGGSVVLFNSLMLVQTVLVVWGVVHAPFFYSIAYLGIILAVGYELSTDVIRAAQLARALQVAEAGLRDGEQRMALAAESANLGFWSRDLTRDGMWATDSWRALLGFTKTDRLDLDSFLERLHPDDRTAVREALARAVTGDGRYEKEYRVLLSDGQVRWIASRGSVECSDGGGPIRMHGASMDITARKNAETDIVRQQTELAHLARASTMGELASALAHELNQPLGAILRNAEAGELLLDSNTPDLEEIRAILADICKDDQRAGAVIDRTRAMLERREPVLTTLTVGELVEGVVALTRSDAASRHVKVRVELEPELPPLYGDRVQLQQVLLNLMLNGMDAMSDLPSDQRRLIVRTRRTDGKTVEVTVTDSGHGIPASKIAHVFDPFFTTKRNGLGMGLSISRTIIEAHGGRLWGGNNPDGGATFQFSMPVTEGAAR